MKFVGGYSHKQYLRDSFNFKVELDKYQQLLLDVDKEDLDSMKHQIRCLETKTATFKRCIVCNRLHIEFKKTLNRLPPYLRNEWQCYCCRVERLNKTKGIALPTELNTWRRKSIARQPLFERVYETWYAAINEGITEETISVTELKALRNNSTMQ